MIDSHTHIYMPEFDSDRDDVIKRAMTAGVTSMILPNVDALSIDALHDTIHEMARDEARHGKALKGLLERYFR